MTRPLEVIERTDPDGRFARFAVKDFRTYVAHTSLPRSQKMVEPDLVGMTARERILL
jgi:hypothetical protein